MTDTGNQRVEEVVPIGVIGDGSVQVRYQPSPPDHRSKFELEWVWSGEHADTVYLGDEECVYELIDVLQTLLREECRP